MTLWNDHYDADFLYFQILENVFSSKSNPGSSGLRGIASQLCEICQDSKKCEGAAAVGPLFVPSLMSTNSSAFLSHVSIKGQKDCSVLSLRLPCKPSCAATAMSTYGCDSRLNALLGWMHWRVGWPEWNEHPPSGHFFIFFSSMLILIDTSHLIFHFIFSQELCSFGRPWAFKELWGNHKICSFQLQSVNLCA